jgi:lipopolysaccharide/colanic/teichoic acid biosynthesis glycosyltransferase
MLKRVLNVIVGAALLALVAPLLALIAVLIKVLGGPGPVFSRQEQTSPGGASFLAWQFRLVPYRGPLDISPAWRSDKPLLTLVVAWLRQYNLDELPKLINVVVGDVGLLDIAHSRGCWRTMRCI